MSLVLRIVGDPDKGFANWSIDEEKSTVAMPSYDGSDTQRMTINLTPKQIAEIDAECIRTQEQEKERSKRLWKILKRSPK